MKNVVVLTGALGLLLACNQLPAYDHLAYLLGVEVFLNLMPAASA